MTRISSFSQSQALIQGAARSQSRLAVSQEQVASGKRANEYSDIARDAATLIGARSFLSRTESYLQVAQNVTGRVQLADAQLTNLVDGTRDLRQTLLEATALGSVEGFDAILSESFSMAVSSLNTRFGNSFLFSGSRTSIPPVNVDTIEDLALLPDAFEAFENDQVRSVARIDDSLNLEFGQLASDVAEPLFAVYQRLYDFHVGPDGPLSGQLNDTQRGFLETEIAALDLAVTQVQNAQTLNGLRAANLEQTVNELTDRSFFLEEFIGSIEDVDMTKAITDLNANQTALQASYRVLGTLNEISIINFI